MITGGQRLKNGGGCGHARAEQGRLDPAFQVRQERLGLVKGRVVGPHVDPARAVLVVLIAQVGCGGMDGRRDRTGLGIDPAQGLGRGAGGFYVLRVHRRSGAETGWRHNARILKTVAG